MGEGGRKWLEQPDWNRQPPSTRISTGASRCRGLMDARDHSMGKIADSLVQRMLKLLEGLLELVL